MIAGHTRCLPVYDYTQLLRGGSSGESRGRFRGMTELRMSHNVQSLLCRLIPSVCENDELCSEKWRPSCSTMLLLFTGALRYQDCQSSPGCYLLLVECLVRLSRDARGRKQKFLGALLLRYDQKPKAPHLHSTGRHV